MKYDPFIPPKLPVNWTGADNVVLVIPVNKDGEAFTTEYVQDPNTGKTVHEIPTLGRNMLTLPGWTIRHTKDSQGRLQQSKTAKTHYLKAVVRDSSGNVVISPETGMPVMEDYRLECFGMNGIPELNKDTDKELIEQLTDCPYNVHHEANYPGNPFGYTPLFMLLDPSEMKTKNHERTKNKRIAMQHVMAVVSDEHPEEYQQMVAALLGIPGTYETHEDVLGAIQDLAYQDPNTYKEKMGDVIANLDKVSSLVKLGLFRGTQMDPTPVSGHIQYEPNVGYYIYGAQKEGNYQDEFVIKATNELELRSALGDKNKSTPYQSLSEAVSFEEVWATFQTVIQERPLDQDGPGILPKRGGRKKTAS